MIKAINVHKSFGDFEVLKGITTTFHESKTNLIIGQSGSGKTVFLKCMLGLFTPEIGDICYGDQNFSELDPKQKRDLRTKIGMVFQGGALFDSMTVQENVMFPLKMFSNSSLAEMKDRVDEVLERVKLVEAHKKFPSEISGGMKKRVSIARAIVNKPKYLFCDEPNSGLDPRTSTVIDNLIQEITKDFKMTTVINTHDMNSVLEIGEKIIYLENGKLAWEGNKDIIFDTDNEAVTKFVYSSELYKKVRIAQQKGY